MDRILEFVAGNGARLIIGAAGDAANEVLQQLSQLTGIAPKACQNDFWAAQTVIFSPDCAHRASGEPTLEETCAGYKVLRGPRSVHLVMFDDENTDSLGRVRYPLMMVVMQAMLNGESCTLLHGALLEGVDGSATVVVASSGVGKSTTARRYIQGGGKAQFDDQMLLCWRETPAGRLELMIHGLPTWSRVFQNGLGKECFGFDRAYPLARLYCLGRGENKEEIRSLPMAVWHGQVIAALLEHLLWPQKILPESEKVAMGQFCWRLANDVDRVFRPLQLLATLDGDLHRTLAQAPEQRV